MISIMGIKLKHKDNQSGMASFLVVTIIVTLVALISLGFSRLADREQRQALDRQLSDQAYYAAESGLNDVRNYLTNFSGATSNTNCAPPNVSPTPFSNKGNISANGLVRYSCVLIDAQPKELIYSLQAGQTISFKINLNTLANLYLGWENQRYTNSPQPLSATFGSLPQENSANLGVDATGVLRTSIYPVPPNSSAPGQDTNAVLNGAMRTYFMYPNGGNGSVGTVDYRTAVKNGAFVGGNCNNSTHPSLPFGQSTPRYCNSEITRLQGSGNVYWIRLTAQYAPLSISIQASDAANNALAISGVEGIVDVTGTGNDVIRRVKAIIPISLNTTLPGYGIQSMQAVCKLFRVPVTSLGQYGFPYLDSGAPNNDGMCLVPFNAGAITGGGIPPIGSLPCPSGYSGNYPNCICPSNSTQNADGSCKCTYGGSWPGACSPQPCQGYSSGSGVPNCSCTYGGSYPNCSGPPPPPPPQPPSSCNSGSVAAWARRSGNYVTFGANAGGCQYYYDSAIGWNGGGTWGPTYSPGQFCHTQQGGVDPWGWLASSQACA